MVKMYIILQIGIFSFLNISCCAVSLSGKIGQFRNYSVWQLLFCQTKLALLIGIKIGRPVTSTHANVKTTARTHAHTLLLPVPQPSWTTTSERTSSDWRILCVICISKTKTKGFGPVFRHKGNPSRPGMPCICFSHFRSILLLCFCLCETSRSSLRKSAQSMPCVLGTQGVIEQSR